LAVRKITSKNAKNNVRTEGLVSIFNDEAENVRGLLAIVKKRAPTEVFSKIIPSKSSEKVGVVTDSRDGKKYKIVIIGKQTWMAENLNYSTSDSKCYGDKPANCDNYGRLYNWSTAICPSGWHLPSKEEWDVLTAVVGGSSTEGKLLKATSRWNSFNGKSGNGTDAYGFAALPGGDGNSSGKFSNIGDFGRWWTSEHDGANAYVRGMVYDSEDAFWNNGSKSYLFSVRCLQGSLSTQTNSKKTTTLLEIRPAYLEGIGKDEQWNLILNEQVFYSLENTLPYGKYKGKLSHNCYEDINFNIDVNRDEQQVFDVAKQVKLKKGGLVLNTEKSSEPVYVNGKQVGKTPFSGSVPLCAEIEIGKGREKVDVELKHNGKVTHTLKSSDDSRGYETSNGNYFFTDSRDGKKYKIVIIGRQAWMAENLNYNANGSKCYGNDPTYCGKYGRLYNWSTAKVVCPKGWHLPSKLEWEVLSDYKGGFSALPGGAYIMYLSWGYEVSGFKYDGSHGYWWSASEYNVDNAYYEHFGDSEYGNDYDDYNSISHFILALFC